MNSLPAIFLTSLVPSAALLGVLFAYYRRNQPTSMRGAMLWLGLLIGSIWLIAWLEGQVLFRELPVLVNLSAFAFVCPPCVHYWLRFHPPGGSTLGALARVLVVSLLVLLGIFWTALVLVVSSGIITSVMNSFR